MVHAHPKAVTLRKPEARIVLSEGKTFEGKFSAALGKSDCVHCPASLVFQKALHRT